MTRFPLATPLPKLAAPARRALESIHVETLEQLATYSEQEIADLHGMGPNALAKLKEALAEMLLGFRRSSR